jgi:hypothetical protein
MRLTLAPSPLLAGLIVVFHTAAGVSAAAVLPEVAGVALGAALIGLGAAAAWSRALLRSPSSILAIEVGGPEGAVLEQRSGARIEARAGARRYVGRLFLTLPAGGSTLLVTRDMLGADAFRRLRIWALWGRLPGVAAKQLPA